MSAASASPAGQHPVVGRRAGALALAAVLVAGLAFGGWAWLRSTRPADPLIASSGLDFEGTNRVSLRVGQTIALTGWLLMSHPATVTGWAAPASDDVTTRVVAITGPPPARSALPVIRHPRPGQGRAGAMLVVASRIVPIAGRRVPPAPPGLRDGHVRFLLPYAVLVTVHRPGCYPVQGVRISYRVGETTFTRVEDAAGATSVSTTNHACPTLAG